MRVTNCPDCGEAVELPLSRDDEDVEVTCPTCGLSGPVEEWWQFEPENNETLLGRPLGDATIPPGMPKPWALRMEQLEGSARAHQALVRLLACRVSSG